MGVRVSFLEPKSTTAAPAAAPRTWVPAAAVREDGGQDIVFVVADGHAARRAVKLGGSQDERRQVLAGLAGGESVVIEAPATLKDGDAVREAGAD
jgi:hypothetical protein